MKYPTILGANLLDVTGAPYFADNTGKTDCTAALIAALNDIVSETVRAVAQTEEKLLEMSDNLNTDAYVGMEAGRAFASSGRIFVTNPEFRPAARLLYFPAGEYLVSDTVAYTRTDVNTQQQAFYRCELCQNLHFIGEGREKTVIRLRDHAEGFEKGASRAVVSFFGYDDYRVETTNCATMNTIEDLTIDCGKGNPGAVGLHFVSSNCGRIENLTIRAEEGECGIRFGYSSEGCVRDVKISGFEYGMDAVLTGPTILDEVDASECRTAGFRASDIAVSAVKFDTGALPPFVFLEGTNPRVYTAKGRETPPFPKRAELNDPALWACVDDFGAVGDGMTDCSLALERAMKSGKPGVCFGKGRYLLNRTVKVPKTVRAVDFRFCDLAAGPYLASGLCDAAFDVCEAGEEQVCFSHLCAHEQLFGFFRLIRHSAVRQVTLRDIATGMACLYYNTVGGSRVFFDNCFTLTGTYSQSSMNGYPPLFCKMIPVELHGQEAYGRNLNIERADTELYAESSLLHVDGFKTEGPGIALKAAGGTRAVIRVWNAGIWNTRIENAIFDLTDSTLEANGGIAFILSGEERFRTLAKIGRAGKEERVSLDTLRKKEPCEYDCRYADQLKF